MREASDLAAQPLDDSVVHDEQPACAAQAWTLPGEQPDSQLDARRCLAGTGWMGPRRRENLPCGQHVGATSRYYMCIRRGSCHLNLPRTVLCLASPV